MYTRIAVDTSVERLTTVRVGRVGTKGANMPKRKKCWDFYKIGWDNGPTYELVKSSTHYKPWGTLERLAKKLGYHLLRREDTIIGGYFANPSGDCLVCIPHGRDPIFYSGVCQ